MEGREREDKGGRRERGRERRRKRERGEEGKGRKMEEEKDTHTQLVHAVYLLSFTFLFFTNTTKWRQISNNTLGQIMYE